MRISSIAMVGGFLFFASATPGFALASDDCKPGAKFCEAAYFVGLNVLPDDMFFSSIPRQWSNNDVFYPADNGGSDDATFPHIKATTGDGMAPR